jgi:methylmalonyl-CoA/ethylmalonyl-CoA epimerase
VLDRPVVFDHIALALPRMADAPALLVAVLGGIPDSGAPSRGFNWGCWRFEGGGRVEVIEPRGDDGFVHRFLVRHGPGIHHVTFKVPDLREACARAEQRGYEIVGYDDSRPCWKEAFLHPKQALGIVVQMTQSSGGAAPRLLPLPPGPPKPPPPVTILGLRMRVRSRERAQRQWEEVLRGECVDDGERRLIYRWPGSPMRLVVEIGGAADEGPTAIEFASSRAILLGSSSPLAPWFAPPAGG